MTNSAQKNGMPSSARPSPGIDRGDPSQDMPFTATADGVRLAVRLTPRAGRDALDGMFRAPDGRIALKIRIAAPPIEGAANTALIAYLAKALAVRKVDVTIASGATGRTKILHIAGEPHALVVRLTRWIAEAGDPG
jgi:uncharacterized protein (TIGR00251 family)